MWVKSSLVALQTGEGWYSVIDKTVVRACTQRVFVGKFQSQATQRRPRRPAGQQLHWYWLAKVISKLSVLIN